MRKATTFLIFMALAAALTLQVGCNSDDPPVTPPPACAITMSTPVGGESWFTGDQINIRWTQTTGGEVMIELLKGATTAGVISASTANNGFYPWLSSSTFGQNSGEDYSIRVSSLTSANCSAQTNPFELVDVSNCFIKFPWTDMNPIPPQKAGFPFLIEWDSEHTSNALDIELWYEPFAQLGELVGIIAQDIPDTGSYLWTVDSFNRGTDEGYRFKIQDVDATACNDASVRFGITDEVNCSIAVLGINGGTTYQQGQVIPISFNFENSSGIVILRLYSGNIPVNGGLITLTPFDTENGTLNYPWSVTSFGHPGPSFNRFNIRAWDADDEYCVGESDDFTIAQ